MVQIDRGTESIGERIRRLRREQGRSLRDIEGPGADHAHISRVEAGHRRATEPFLRTVARNLGVSVAYLRNGENGDETTRLRARLDDLELRLRVGEVDPAGDVVRDLRRLHAEAVAGGEPELAVRCRLLIGCASSDSGDHPAAVRELGRLVDAGVLSAQAEPEAYLSLARSLTALGCADEAVSLLEAGLAEVGRDEIASARFATYLSFALVDAGELRRARKVVRDAIARADGLEDMTSRVRLYWARARLAWAEADWSTGRMYAQRAIGLYGALEDGRNLARLNLLSGDMSLMAGDLEEAERSVAEAARLLGPDADAQDRGSLRFAQAQVTCRRGEPERAVELAWESIDLLAGDPAWQGRGYWALAEALVGAGRYDEGLDAFDCAYPLLRIEGRFMGPFLHAWASALCTVGREREAVELFMSAVTGNVLTSADLGGGTV